MKKRLFAVLLVLALALSLAACESEEVKAAREAIDAIGTVTTESGAAIEAARALYDALPAEEQEKVKNYDVLVNAEFDFILPGFDKSVYDLVTPLQEIYVWIDTAWTNAEVTWNSLDLTVTGEALAGFISNAEVFTGTGSYDLIAAIVSTDMANIVKVQSYAMHIGAPAPTYYEDVLLSDLEAAGAFEKNIRITDLKSERLTAALALSLYESDFAEYAALLPEKAAAAQRVLDAALAYNNAVFDDLATYATEADWQAACEAALAELAAADEALKALAEG